MRTLLLLKRLAGNQGAVANARRELEAARARVELANAVVRRVSVTELRPVAAPRTAVAA